MEARDPARPVTVLYDISSIRADGIRPLPLRSVSVDEQPEEEAADRQAAERDAADGQRDEKPYADDRVVGSRGTERRDAGDWIRRAMTQEAAKERCSSEPGCGEPGHREQRRRE